MDSGENASIGWPAFFAVFGAVMFVFLVAPAAFGFQNFNQWGGMYDEHWCYVEAYSSNPNVSGQAPEHEQLSAGFTGTSRVYSGPMNNEATCLMWARSRCGTKAPKGWVIRWAVPSLKGHAFTSGKNVCDMKLPHTSPWFRYER